MKKYGGIKDKRPKEGMDRTNKESKSQKDMRETEGGLLTADEKKYLTKSQREKLNKGLKMAIIRKKKEMEKK